jgi:hypothetical protein
VSLEGRGGESFGEREIERKLEKSFAFFEKVFFYRESISFATFNQSLRHIK